MRWENSVKRYLERVEGEWRTTTTDRRRPRLTENVMREKKTRDNKRRTTRHHFQCGVLVS